MKISNLVLSPVLAANNLETTVNLSEIDSPATAFDGASPTLAGIFTGGGINLFTLLFFIVGFIFFVSLSIAGFQYVTSEGNPKKIQQANQRLIQSLLGLAISVAAFFIVNIIASIFGLGNILNLPNTPANTNTSTTTIPGPGDPGFDPNRPTN